MEILIAVLKSYPPDCTLVVCSFPSLKNEFLWDTTLVNAQLGSPISEFEIQHKLCASHPTQNAEQASGDLEKHGALPSPYKPLTVASVGTGKATMV